VIVLRMLTLVVVTLGLACSSGCGETPADMEPIVQTKPPAEAKAKAGNPSRGGAESGPATGAKKPGGRRGQRRN
jgi:hypothetical protein